MYQFKNASNLRSHVRNAHAHLLPSKDVEKNRSRNDQLKVSIELIKKLFKTGSELKLRGQMRDLRQVFLSIESAFISKDERINYKGRSLAH